MRTSSWMCSVCGRGGLDDPVFIAVFAGCSPTTGRILVVVDGSMWTGPSKPRLPVYQQASKQNSMLLSQARQTGGRLPGSDEADMWMNFMARRHTMQSIRALASRTARPAGF